VLAALDRALHEIDDEILAALTSSQRATLNGLLAQAVEHIHADCSSPSVDPC
jgi:Spy/CpxP family protein refolding chaperone